MIHDLPGVGQNLQDHLEVHIKHLSPHRGISKNRSPPGTGSCWRGWSGT